MAKEIRNNRFKDTRERKGYVVDMSASTIEEDAMTGGWTRINAPVGGKPAKGRTSGMRGEPADGASNDYDR